MPDIAIDTSFLERLLAVGEGAPPVSHKARMLRLFRAQSEDHANVLDVYVAEHVTRLAQGLHDAQTHQERLEQLLDKLGATPWFPAVYLGPYLAEGEEERALVMHGTQRRIVGLAEGLALDSITIGEEVLLGSELNVVIGRSGTGVPTWGETASLDEMLEDGRLVLQWHDDRVVVHLADTLQGVALESGDLVRWDRNASLAYEKIERKDRCEFALEEVPEIGREAVGGQDENLDRLLTCLTAKVVHPDLAREYGIPEGRAIMLVGPPGCGKTLMARVAASELGRASDQRTFFAVVSPAGFEDPYVGVTQQKIRHFFRQCRDAARRGPVVVFFDEIDAMGRARGHSAAIHSDKFLDAFLTEMDGFAGQPNVAIIGATNRKDLLDSGLLSRFGEVEIEVLPPDLEGSRAIFGIHLPATLPYAGGDAEREDMIETAVSLFFGHNSPNALARITFATGETRTVHAHEQISGRLISQVCAAAREAAFVRTMRGGDQGLRVSDIENAVAGAFERLKSTLHPHNVRHFITGLPQDVPITSVEPIRGRVTHSRKFLKFAS